MARFEADIPAARTVDDAELLSAISEVQDVHGKTIVREALRRCMIVADQISNEEMSVTNVINLTISQCFPKREKPKAGLKLLYAEGILHIYLRRHSFAVRYAEAHGWDQPPIQFKSPSMAGYFRQHKAR